MAKHKYGYRRKKIRRKNGGSQKKGNMRCKDYPRPPAGPPPEHVRNDPTRQLNGGKGRSEIVVPGAYVDNEQEVPGAYVDVHLLLWIPETVMGAPKPLLICGSSKPSASVDRRNRGGI